MDEMGIDSYVKYLPPYLSKWAVRHLKIVRAEQYETMAVTYKDGFVLYYNPEFWGKASEEERRYLLLHELSHIYRGDIFKHFGEKEDYLWNIVEDAVINQHLGNTEITRRLGGIWYDDLNSQLGNPLPQHLGLCSEAEIFEVLRQRYDEHEAQLKQLLSQLRQSSDVIRIPTSSLSPIEKVMVFKAITELAKGAKGELNMDGAGLNISTAPQKYRPPRLHTLPFIEELMKLCVQSGNRFKRRRSYRREGVAEGLRGISHQRIGKVFLGVDVSGSVASLIPSFLGLATWLIEKKFIVELGSFSDSFVLYSHLPHGEFDMKGVGGGTQIKELMDYLAKEDYDLGLIITDGEIFDWDTSLSERLDFPVVWILPNANSSFRIPEKDVLVVAPQLSE